MTRDKLFAKSQSLTTDFHFGKQTANVFDDMLLRSVPYYVEMQRMISELAGDFAVAGTNVYDFGCSTGNTFLMLDSVVPPTTRFIGIDDSAAMLERTRQKLKTRRLQHRVKLVCADLNRSVKVTNASLGILALTLQFIRPLRRQKLMEMIARGTNKHGALILVEKVLSQESTLNRLFIKHYYDFKRRNGYSELEIAQKREALENILVPYRLEENIDLLLTSGFRHCEVFFKWYNFCGIVAVK